MSVCFHSFTCVLNKMPPHFELYMVRFVRLWHSFVFCWKHWQEIWSLQGCWWVHVLQLWCIKTQKDSVNSPSVNSSVLLIFSLIMQHCEQQLCFAIIIKAYLQDRKKSAGHHFLPFSHYVHISNIVTWYFSAATKPTHDSQISTSKPHACYWWGN